MFKTGPSMQLPELMLAMFPQNTDVFKMSNGLLGKHVSAM